MARRRRAQKRKIELDPRFQNETVSKFINKVMFDGSEMHGRHVLIAVKADAPAAEKQAAQTKLTGLKADILKRAGELAAKNDPNADPVTKAKAKLENLESAFAEVAAKESDCPSKKNGGDLGFFPRIGVMVDGFAAAAFALEPGTMTEIVETQFGYHLILSIEKKAGKEVKFADLKEPVREVYGEKLKQVMVPQLKQRHFAFRWMSVSGMPWPSRRSRWYFLVSSVFHPRCFAPTPPKQWSLRSSKPR